MLNIHFLDWGKNRPKKHYLQLHELRCEVYNEKGRKIVDELMPEEVGNEAVYARYFGTLKWENENRIVVKSKSSSWKAEICLYIFNKWLLSLKRWL